MANDEVAEALTREHRIIDAGIEEFLRARDAGTIDATPLLGAMDALRRHIFLEETFLFPPLREAGLTMPIMVMLREHGALWNSMDELSNQLEAAGTDIAGLCNDLLAALDSHNSKEEPIIYPRAGVDLPEFTYAQLRDFIADGRMPDGWVCATAR